MTAGIDEAPRDRRGELVTVADAELKFVEQTGPWVELTPPDSQVGFTVHESQVNAAERRGSAVA